MSIVSSQEQVNCWELICFQSCLSFCSRDKAFILCTRTKLHLPCTGPCPQANLFNLDLTVQGHSTLIPLSNPSLFTMKHGLSESGRLPLDWNAFLLSLRQYNSELHNLSGNPMQLKNGHLGRDTLQFYLHFSACVSDEGVVIEIPEDGEREGSIESPGYPYVVPEHSRCRWTIIAPDGNVGD